ncbi:acetate kinase [Sphaerisporangium sp. TRM90804]|uniref:acetate/propionate family kinase n=1 Tax=Sphaerisporangium sp. TRM90804 TaxID=3031113 RepID=UPI00244905EA|nr:acetate kinase [Sphaerisporangium sp. TRM90804]MDH2430739.1 acetate kinase [Sphaerisporangium sp. TRM90804]
MSERVLVLNIGSSSVKYELLEVASGRREARGLVERVGGPEGTLTHSPGGYRRDAPYPGHRAALEAMRRAFAEAGPDLATAGVTAVGHRIVHGGSRFTGPALVDDAVLAQIEELTPLAPLHNPAGVTGIRVAGEMFPGVPQVAVFDTAFHHTLPPHARTYAVPRRWETELGVRRYGFHGTSFAYVTRRAAELLGRDPSDLNLIVLHLGNGASAAAVRGGASVDTSMGMTPLEGLVMGTRSGDLDPAVPFYVSRATGQAPEEVDRALSRESGLLGLSGDGDMREVWRRSDAGDAAATLALEVYRHRLRKYVGAYYAVLGRVDAVVFTAGVGEHDSRTRAAALAGLERLGIAVDPARNRDTTEGAISPEHAEVTVLVVPTDEEYEIALQTLATARPR